MIEYLILRFKFVSFCYIFRLIKHTGKLLEEKEEKLCIKVLQTLKEMMSFEIELGIKVFTECLSHSVFDIIEKCILKVFLLIITTVLTLFSWINCAGHY